LNYLFGVSKNSQFRENDSVRNKTCLWEKSRVICATDNEFPQELKTVRFNLEPKRCKSVSLSGKRSVSTLVGLAHGVVTEKLRFPYYVLLISVKMLGVDSCVFLIFTTRVDQTNGSTLVKLILFEKSRLELEFVFSIYTTRVRKHFVNSGRLTGLWSLESRNITEY